MDAWPPPAHDVYRPLWSPEGVGIFPRDPGSAKEVWSAAEGYPGDFRYREFYRDLGYDAPDDMLDPQHKQGTGAKKNMGLKLHRITGRVSLDEKAPYVPAWAHEAVQTHAAHFGFDDQLRRLKSQRGRELLADLLAAAVAVHVAVGANITDDIEDVGVA